MKITNAYAETYRWEKPRVMTSGRGRGSQKYVYSNLSLIYIETDEGITGVGAGLQTPHFEGLKSLLMGEDPLCIEKIWQKIYATREGKKYIETLSVIDIALWDLKAKVAGLPLYKLLGGVRTKLDCYVAGGYYAPGKTILDLQHEMELYLSWNAKAVKMKVGGMSPLEDARRVKAVREVIGPDIKLLVDANCAWKLSEAAEFAKRVEEEMVYWFEEPLNAMDFGGFQKLSAMTNIPLAAGESLYALEQQACLLETNAISFIQPDACLTGGVSQVVKIAHAAEAKHIFIAPHGLQQVHVHLNCAISNAAITEFYSPTFDKLVYDAYKYPVLINEDGTVSPQDIPGAGLEINKDVLAPYRVK